MKKFLPLLSFLLFIFLSINLQSQEQKATMIVKSESVIKVPSIATQISSGTFVQAENIVKEFNPKRWGKNSAVPGKGLPSGKDPLWDKQIKVKKSPGRETILDFEAASSGSTPTDPTGAVGPNHFLNSWNSAFRIWDKSGNPLISAASLSTIFPGTLGDPIVMYDPYADRFFISEFYSNGFDVAVSQGPDPVNDGWYVYRFATNTFPDYPKFSIWSDGYYITANKDQGSASTSEVVFVLERDKMINGEVAQMVGFPLTDIVTSGFYSPLGFNCNGSTLPPAGDAPIVYMQDDSWSGVSTDHLKIWTVDVNWTTPGNSTISSPQIINTAPFDGLFDGGSFSNLPQPSGINDVDALQATIMYMAQYRRFPTYNSVVFNFVVDLDGNDDYSGIRWYELRQPNDGDPWQIEQEGTYSQPDGHSAFCGNMCMDAAGNIALAYTIVSSTQFPSLRFTGRYANDPSGDMTIAEDVIVNGTQSDPSTRYGDYSQMTIDPSDDATFWSIGEVFSGGTRKNHVGVFQLSAPALTAQFSGTPINVCTNGNVTFTDNSLGSPTSWDWIFEGGTPNTYTGQSPPPITYDIPGTYDVTLEVGDGSTTNSLTLTDYISVQNIISDFSANQTTLFEGGSVTFTDQSLCAPTSWEWTFDGGTPSTYVGETPPAITYSVAGSYNVSLTTTNSNGTDTEVKTDYISVLTCVPCETSYSDQDDDWISNISFNTIDNTTAAEPGGYGDYTNISTSISENQMYTLSVSVTVGGDWVQHVWAWIDWNNNCDFTDAGEAYDLGQTSGSSGTETLTIDITVPAGLSTISKIMRVSERYSSDPEPCTSATYGEAEDYSLNINNTSLPVADFSADDVTPTIGQTVNFTDLSTNTPTSWTWAFTPGTVTYVGGTNANSQNPQVQFDAAGSYDVALTATNAGGSDTETKVSYINVAVAAPVADFSADNTTPTTDETVNFTDLSTNNPTSWSWSFTPSTVTYMGGTNASSQNPQVRFDAPGAYDVELIATNAGGSDTETKTSYINATDPPPVADFSADNTTPTTDETVNFTDLSTNNPTSWSWSFTPSTVTYMGGTNASSQNPQVRFDAPGAYDVELTATNAAGSNTETKTSYINATDPPPVANFSADDVNPITGQTVTFTDLSTNNPTSWAWSFTPSTITYVGGTNASSQHPQVQFDAVGDYTVELTATNAGGSDTEIKTDYISVAIPSPVADFSADNTTPTTDETVNFTDLSTNSPTSWSWSFTPSTVTFMEGTNANSQHPKVRFDNTGLYTVELTATNGTGSDTETKTDYIDVSIPAPLADFIANNTTPETTETVSFTDLTTNSPTSWAWVFTPNTITYMGGTDASSQNPQVRFDAEGLYDVQLTATNSTGSDIELKLDYINCTNVAPPPDANFSADNTTPTTEETVSFTDLSSNNPTSWAWSFTPATVTFMGGTDASSQNPQVRFDNPGSYDVSLTSTNAVGSDTETKTDYINATDPAPVTDFEADNVSPLTNETVNFTDLSTNNPTSWSWSFTPTTVTYMEGTNSNSQHPKVQFDNAGFYTVELTATNAGGSDTETKTDYINASDPQDPPVADFEADILTPTVEETVTFTDLSTNTPTSWAWSFTPTTITYMEGTDASSQHPKVRFDVPGAYTVELTATNDGGSDTEIKTDYINATVVPPIADFEADNTTPEIGETVSFTDLSTNNPSSWLWSFDPGTVTYVSGTDQNSQHPQVQFNATGLYSVELTATNGGGSDTETKTGYINVGDVFEVIATANPDVICAGQSSLLQSFPSGGSGNYTFFWTSDPPGFTSNDQNVLAYPDITTTYTVEVDDGNQIVSADVLVTVNPLPNITLGNWPDILCNQNEPPVQLTASPTGGIYSGPGVTMNGLFDPEVAPLGWNVITYTYTDALGCSNAAQDSIFVDDCVGIYNPNELNTHLILYPNPNDGKFTMSCSHIIKRIEIINQMGELIASEKYNAKEVQLNIILPKGLYFVRTIVTDKNNKTALVNKSLMIQ